MQLNEKESSFSKGCFWGLSGCISISMGSFDFNNTVKMKFLHLFNKGQSDDEVIRKLTESNPRLSKFINDWNTTKLSNSSLTSVGIAIALTNLKRMLGGYWDYSIWLNE